VALDLAIAVRRLAGGKGRRREVSGKANEESRGSPRSAAVAHAMMDEGRSCDDDKLKAAAGGSLTWPGLSFVHSHIRSGAEERMQVLAW
jgi:hypothetical protein